MTQDNYQQYFLNQLKKINQNVKRNIYLSTSATSLLPVNINSGAGVQTLNYQEIEPTGYAKVIANYTDDLPAVNANYIERQLNIRSIASSFCYSIQEVRYAQQQGIDLNENQANSVRYAIEQAIDDIAWNGDEAYGLYGLSNYPAIENITVSAGTGGSTSWIGANAKTSDEILLDMTETVEMFLENTNGLIIPDTMVMPASQYSLIASKPRSSSSDVTILEFFKKSYPKINVHPVSKLKGQGLEGTDMLALYEKDSHKLAIELPVPYEQMDPQQKNLTYYVYAHARTGGLAVYQPKAILIRSGV